MKSKLPNAHDNSTSHELGNLIAIGALCCLWLGLVTFGWARWGSVTVDSGREIYVAAALVEGKMLYRDIWYPYSPGAPYLNALLFQIFGIHITVSYTGGNACRARRGAYAIPFRSISRAAARGFGARLHRIDSVIRSGNFHVPAAIQLRFGLWLRSSMLVSLVRGSRRSHAGENSSILGRNMLCRGFADEARIWIRLLCYACGAADRAGRTAKILACGSREFAGYYTRVISLRSCDRMDDIYSRSNLHYGGEFYKLANVLFHEGIRRVLARRTRI